MSNTVRPASPSPAAAKFTFTVARIVALEAARRDATAYVRGLQQPVYGSSDKGTRDQKEDVKPVRLLDVWWHDRTLCMLASIQGWALKRLNPVLKKWTNTHQAEPCHLA
ncbi:hypothetical protein L210DRAFT_3513893 [Boletus edulis BED1]|uniref:Uncharacterized protein n=1 Tax=Boletus edulis BED1 TaxID=1328754 RepID=A0AAD4B8G1_BOLED|nr:hypothetical protein L210DRAFT_3513893 [Boletus edulis BED1]